MSARGFDRILAAFAALLLGSCALHMELPEGFLQLNTSGGELKATTPEDARVWVREFDDPDGGTLDFWAETLKRDLVDHRGYRFVAEEEVEDGSGRPGRLMEFTATVAGERMGYLVAVFTVSGLFRDAVRVVEFAAAQEVYDRHAGEVKAAIATLQP